MWFFCKSCQNADWILFQLAALGIFIIVAGILKIGSILIEEFKKKEDQK